MKTLMAQVRRFTGIVNPLGWTVLVAGAALVIAAAYTDWRELAVPVSYTHLTLPTTERV